MFLPLRTDAPLRHTPWMNWAIIVANLLVYVAQLAYPRQLEALSLAPTDPHLLNYFTYAFLHGGLLHVGGNMLFLYIFGNNVNDKMGQWGYLGFYLAGGVVAGIVYVLGGGAPVIGASGAVSAVTGAFLILFPRARVMVLFFFLLIFTYEIPSVILIAAFFALDLFQQVSPAVFGLSDNTAHLAHIGGTLFGVVVPLGLLAAHLLPRDQFDAIALIQRWNRRRVYRDQVNRGWNPYGADEAGLGRGKHRRADATMERVQDLRASISEAIAHDKLPEAATLYLQLHAVDSEQVLSRQNQLDVANHLFAEGRHRDAADAYEQFLRHYARYDQIEQVQLILGLIYARYLHRPDAARTQLSAALEKLHNPSEIDVARSELARVEAKLEQVRA